MAQQQILEGTWEELSLRAAEFAGTGKKMKLIVPADETARAEGNGAHANKPTGTKGAGQPGQKRLKAYGMLAGGKLISSEEFSREKQRELDEEEGRA